MFFSTYKQRTIEGKVQQCSKSYSVVIHIRQLSRKTLPTLKQCQNSMRKHVNRF
nr:MAG TPA: hypothetical protein [Caudoviricetes sp.]